MRVLKFGGTSVANAERFLRVADILESNARQGQVATVLSAPAKITNHLVAMIEKTISGQDALPNISDAERIFAELLTGLAAAQPGFPLAQLKTFVDQEFAQIKHVLHGISLLGQCPDSINAALICRGEKMSIAIMAGVLEARGHNVTVIDPVEKLLAVGHYLESTVDIAESTRRIAASRIPADHMVLMAGFTAGNEKGELVVLGRNGSDYSAAVLAACLRADCCEIWTDVDGVYTCDPRQVPDARLLKSMSYQEAMELSYFGAKVLHPRTITPIAQFQIPCLIKNTGNPQAPGTLIGASRDEDELPVKGISNLNNMAMFSVSGPGMKGMVGMAARVFAAMSRARISVVLITQSSSEYSISFCVPQSDCVRAERAMQEEFYLELKEGLLEPLAVTERLAIISVVGDGMRTLRGISAKFFAALARANINIVAIAQGSSERSISVVVNNDDATKLQLKESATQPEGERANLRVITQNRQALSDITAILPDGNKVMMSSLRQFSGTQPLYTLDGDGTLTNNQSGVKYRPNNQIGFYQSITADGNWGDEKLSPGYTVTTGWKNFTRVFTDEGIQKPFLAIFVWTVVFSLITVFLTVAVGMVLACLVQWEALRGKAVYRVLLILPYAVPSFISILIFKGLFNQSFGEINMMLSALFGVKPAWFSDPTTARTMLIIVNTWLGYPYMMILCMGLLKAIPDDLYEASAMDGAGPFQNFFKITLPLLIKPLTPLMIASFAFNFNNFVLIQLLTNGGPDRLGTTTPAGYTDLLVNYTYRIAFEGGGGQDFGLAAAIATLIFLLVGALAIVNLKATRMKFD